MSQLVEQSTRRPFWANRTGYSLPRAVFRKLVHFFSYHFILQRTRTTSTRVSGLQLTVQPTVFNPKIFLTSKFFADFVQGLDLSGKRVVDVGTGSGILALSAAKAGAISVLALDINPAAVSATALNAIANNFQDRVSSMESNLFSAVAPDQSFDVVLSSPPSFSGEPLSISDRAWHAGPNYRDIQPLFGQAQKRLRPGGVMYLLLSSDSDLELFEQLITEAGLSSKLVAEHSIVIKSFLLFELSATMNAPSLVPKSTAAT